MRTLVIGITVGLVMSSSACGGRDERPRGDGGGPLDAATSDAAVETDAGGSARVPGCVETCSAPSDCAGTAQTADADNFECEAGRCHHLGCNDDGECQADLGATWVCVAGAGRVGEPGCVETCGSASDCAQSGAMTGVDNYACDAGRCRYLGCNADAECQADLGALGGTWVCTAGAGPAGVPGCVEACSSPSDCGGSGQTNGADNYACEAGRCRHTGCNTDTECRADFGASTWVCLP